MTNHPSSSATLSPPPHPMNAPDAPSRDHALDLTRAAITLLVIAHHAVLAYHRYAPAPGAFTAADRWWGAFPIIDSARAPGLDAFTLWNDSFFMAMMFLLAGLFVPPSLARKGAGRFLRDRAVRLGLPFVVSAAVLAPLAYWPAYQFRADATGQPGFVAAWRALGHWPAGPAWFLWVLLGFCAVAAVLHTMLPRAVARLAAFGSWCRAHPVDACAALGAAASLVYLIAVWRVSPFIWPVWGPFTVQISRVPLYAVYFCFGCAVSLGGRGAIGDWMAPGGPLARRWVAWQTTAGIVFIIYVAALITWLTLAGQGKSSLLVNTITNLAFALTGVATTFALLAGLARWGHWRHPAVASLTRNAFGMYLVHYPIVTWTQWLLLDAAMPALLKAAVVTVFAIGASWGAAHLLRRLPGIGRVI